MGTVYIVGDHVVGTNFKHWLSQLQQPPSQMALDRICDSLLSALELIHANELLHRGIKPKTILIRESGLPVLLDFGGAARDRDVDVSTAIVSEAYSAIETYTSHSAQGPWTDVYSLAATLHDAVAGNAVANAQRRGFHDDYKPLIQRVSPGRYRPSFLKAIDWGLSVLPADRPQDVRQWRPMLLPQVATQVSAVGTKLFISYRRRETADVCRAHL